MTHLAPSASAIAAPRGRRRRRPRRRAPADRPVGADHRRLVPGPVDRHRPAGALGDRLTPQAAYRRPRRTRVCLAGDPAAKPGHGRAGRALLGIRMNATRESWRLAWPLILSNLSVPLLGVVDTAVVGHLDAPRYLGGVALGALVMSVLYWLFGFLRMGTTALTAQAFGAADTAETRAAAGAGDAAGRRPGPRWSSWSGRWSCLLSERLFAPAAEVAAEFERYLAIRLFGAPAALASMVLLGWLLGLQDSRRPAAPDDPHQRHQRGARRSCSCSASGSRPRGVAHGHGAGRVCRPRASACSSCAAPGAARAAGRAGRAILVLGAVSPPARGQPRPVPAQPAAGGGLPRLRRHRLAPGRGGARRQRRADELLHRRRLRARRLRPRRRGHGRPHRGCPRPAGLSRRRAGELRQRRPARRPDDPGVRRCSAARACG